MLYAIFTVAGLLVGVVLTLAVMTTLHERNARRRKARKRPPPGSKESPSDSPEKKPFEFSKIVLGFVMLTYFIGLGFGIYAVNKILLDYPEWAIQALIALFGYVGTPTGVTIGFYSWKAKAENTIKIKKSNPVETEGMPVDLNNIHT